MDFLRPLKFGIYDNTDTFLLWKNYLRNHPPEAGHTVMIASRPQPIDTVDHTLRKVRLKNGPEVYKVFVGTKEIGTYTFTVHNVARKTVKMHIERKDYRAIDVDHEKKTITAVEVVDKPKRRR